MGSLVQIGIARKRKEIEEACAYTIAAWNEQYSFTTNLMKTDLAVKIALAYSDRDRALAKLDGGETQNFLPDIVRGHS